MKATAIILILLIIGYGYYYINFKNKEITNQQNTNQQIKIPQNTNQEKTNQTIDNKMNKNITKISAKGGKFKYFQLVIANGNGVTGKISLNNINLSEFSGTPKQITSNEAQTIIKNGENVINLNVTKVDNQTDKAAFSDAVIDIILYGTNTQDFPTENDELVHIKWNPEGNSQDNVEYLFNIIR